MVAWTIKQAKGDRTRIRANPSLIASTLGFVEDGDLVSIDFGTKVTARDNTFTWYQILHENALGVSIIGYVADHATIDFVDPPQQPAPIPTDVYTITQVQRVAIAGGLVAAMSALDDMMVAISKIKNALESIYTVIQERDDRIEDIPA